MAGKLYLVPTPIGNLGDISRRAAEVLAAADFIAAEDTRVTVKLLNHLGLKKAMVTYHRHNTDSGAQAVIDDPRHGALDLDGGGRIDARARGRPAGAPDPVLLQHDPGDAGPAVMGVDPLDHHRREMLQLEREDALDAHDQRAGFGRGGLAPAALRPFQLGRPAVACQPLAADLRPGGQDVGRGESLRREGRPDATLDQLG